MSKESKSFLQKVTKKYKQEFNKLKTSGDYSCKKINVKFYATTVEILALLLFYPEETTKLLVLWFS